MDVVSAVAGDLRPVEVERLRRRHRISVADAEDCFGESVCRLLGSAAFRVGPGLTVAGAVRAYLRSIAERIVIDRARPKRRRPRVGGVDGGRLDNLVLRERAAWSLTDREAVWWAMSRLSPESGRAVELVCLRGMTLVAAAAEEGVSRSTLALRLKVGKEHLRLDLWPLIAA